MGLDRLQAYRPFEGSTEHKRMEEHDMDRDDFRRACQFAGFLAALLTGLVAGNSLWFIRILRTSSQRIAT